jgi:integrase
MADQLLEKLLVDLKGVDPEQLIAAFAQVVRQTAVTQPAASVGVLTFAEIWPRYEDWGETNLDGWKAVQGVHGPKHLLPYWGHRPWADCGYTAADAYIVHRRTVDLNDNGSVPANATLNREMATVKAMLNWCLQRPELGVKHNPLARYPDLPESEVRKFVISEEEFVRIVEHARPLLRLMLIFALETGMRRDEFRNLEWTEIDLANGWIDLPAAREKTRKGRRIALSDMALQILERARVPGSPWVFPSPTSRVPKPVPKSTLGQWLDDARTVAGVKGPKGQNVWFHTFRKTSVVEKLLAGMDLQRNMDLHGHTDKRTHDQYRILVPEYIQQTREALNRRRVGPKPAEPAPPPAEPKQSPLLRFLDGG